MNTDKLPPVVSIIVPVYNVELYLDRCLQSIANQTLMDIEVIIVDDGSTDSSLEISNNFSIKYNHFLTYSKVNEGQGIARNFGLEKATGKFICYVDSDDWIEPTLCEHMANVLQQTNADFANFGVDFNSEAGKVVKKIDKFEVSELAGDTIFLNALIDKYVMSISWNKIYRRNFLLDNRIIFPPIRVNEDLFYSRAVASYAKKAVFISKVYYHALVRAGSTSRKMSAQMFHTSKTLIQYEQEYFKKQLEVEVTQRYFCAHVVKLFSYMLIQASFRISDFTEYKSCFDIAKSVGFYDYCSRKNVISLLNFKGRLMLTLCHYPSALRMMATTLKKLGLTSFVY
jgi:glycosyltransferase involved in cell wall biosynthesis